MVIEIDSNITRTVYPGCKNCMASTNILL